MQGRGVRDTPCGGQHPPPSPGDLEGKIALIPQNAAGVRNLTEPLNVLDRPKASMPNKGIRQVLVAVAEGYLTNNSALTLRDLSRCAWSVRIRLSSSIFPMGSWGSFDQNMP